MSVHKPESYFSLSWWVQIFVNSLSLPPNGLGCLSCVHIMQERGSHILWYFCRVELHELLFDLSCLLFLYINQFNCACCWLLSWKYYVLVSTHTVRRAAVVTTWHGKLEILGNYSYSSRGSTKWLFNWTYVTLVCSTVWMAVALKQIGLCHATLQGPSKAL